MPFDSFEKGHVQVVSVTVFFGVSTSRFTKSTVYPRPRYTIRYVWARLDLIH